jgi:hypothetical protein
MCSCFSIKGDLGIRVVKVCDLRPQVNDVGSRPVTHLRCLGFKDVQCFDILYARVVGHDRVSHARRRQL